MDAKIDEEKMEIYRKMTFGRCGAYSGYFHKDFYTAMKNGLRWRASIGGVNISDNEPTGFSTRQEAISHAQAFKARMKIWWSENCDQ